MRRHAEGKADIHAGGIVLDGGVEKLLDLGEGDDLVEFAFDLGVFHAEDGAVHVDVFAAAEFGVKSGADFQQRGDTTAKAGDAFGRLGDPAEKLEQRAFPGAVATDKAHDFTALDLKRNVP